MSETKARKKISRISPEQFVKAYYENDKNGTRAVKAIDKEISDAVAGVKATRLLKNDRVQLLLQNIEDSFKLNAIKASKRLGTLIDSENETISLNASTKVLDYAGFKPIDKSLNMNISIDTAMDELL